MIFYMNDFSRKVGFETFISESMRDSESLKWNEVCSSKSLQHCETCSGLSFKTVMYSYSFKMFLKSHLFRCKIAGKS